MARGVLLVLLGQGTKLSPFLTAGQKIYQGCLRLGLETDTFDIQGQVLARYEWRHVRPEDLQQEIESWRALHTQQIPAYSAAKHQGQAFYKLKRQGKEPPEKYKQIAIDQAQVLDLCLPEVRFRVACSAGTFIRSLAHSLGKRLNCGAVLTDLLREACPPFGLQQAYSLQEILQEPQHLESRLFSIAEALAHWPKIYLQNEQARQVMQGCKLRLQDTAGGESCPPGTKALFLNWREQPVALVQAQAGSQTPFWEILRGFASAHSRL